MITIGMFAYEMSIKASKSQASNLNEIALDKVFLRTLSHVF